MKKLMLTVGLPRSGKSTWAKARGFPVVNPDSIRLSLHGEAYLPSMEPYVWAIAKTMVQSLFHAGHDTVILDATNLTHERRKTWDGNGRWSVQCVTFRAPAQVCQDRAAAGNRVDLIPVIKRMSKTIEWPSLSVSP